MHQNAANIIDYSHTHGFDEVEQKVLEYFVQKKWKVKDKKGRWKWNLWKTINITAALSVGLIKLSNSVPILAETNDNIQKIDQEKSQSVSVTYIQESVFTISIIKNVTIKNNNENNTKSATYQISVSGDIAGNKAVNVNLTNNQINLTNSNGKPAVQADVVLDKTIFPYNEIITTPAVSSGTIEANSLSSGNWTGTITFNINLNNYRFPAGLYDANDVMIAS